MNNPNFSDKDLKIIREIAIRLYNDTNPNGLKPMDYNFQITAEATYVYLKRMGMLKDED